jgi:hypothetical protein
MIDSMFQAGTDQALDDMVRRPRLDIPPQEGEFSFLKALRGAPRGVAAAAANTLAFGAEITGAFGETAGAVGYGSRGGMFSQPTEQEKQQQEQARRKLLDKGPEFSNEAGDIFRTRAKDIMPNPQTTHASEQVIAGITQFATQAIGYAATTGPAAPLLLAGDVGMAEADKLKQEGVDLATRTKAGFVAGAAAGVSIALPVAVPGSVAKTAAAVVAGGPGSFVAQNAAERAILQHAGYDKIASTYDPFDPVGLALSTVVPAGFGAWAVRGAKVKPATGPATNIHQVVQQMESGGQRFGKDGQLLTSPKGAKGEMQVMDATNLDPGFGVRPAADNSPAERARVGRDYLDAMLKRYGGDEAQAMAAYNAGPGALDKALAKAKKQGGDWLRFLPEETQAYVAKGTAALRDGRIGAVADADGVAAARTRQTAQVVDSYRLTPDSDVAGMTRHQQAIESAHDQMAAGQPVDVPSLVLTEVPAEHPFVPWVQQVDSAVAELRALRQAEAVTPGVEVTAPRDAGVAPLERVDGTLNATEVGRETSPFKALIDEIAPLLKGKEPGQVASELKSAGKLSPLANNTLVGIVESGGQPKRLASLVSHAERLASETPGRSAGDVMADAVEMMRAGVEAPKAEAPSPHAEALARIEQGNPDMPVGVTEDGTHITAREELEAIRREAAEGTDTTLGADDAPLLQVAAECFLSSGGI